MKKQYKIIKIFSTISIIILSIALFALTKFFYIRNQYLITNNLFEVNKIVDCRNKNEAPNDGSIGLWMGNGNPYDNNSDYYIVHDFSFYGKLLLKSKKNQYIKIKNKKYIIYNIVNVSKNSKWNDVKDFAFPGGDTASFQVCIPNSNLNKIIICKSKN